MSAHPSSSNSEAYLGVLAMKFRGTDDGAERRAIAVEYAKSVNKLISSGRWMEMPPPEDQLPDEYMPEEFFEFWSR
jgi:hypothetical protein